MVRWIGIHVLRLYLQRFLMDNWRFALFTSVSSIWWRLSINAVTMTSGVRVPCAYCVWEFCKSYQVLAKEFSVVCPPKARLVLFVFRKVGRDSAEQWARMHKSHSTISEGFRCCETAPKLPLWIAFLRQPFPFLRFEVAGSCLERNRKRTMPWWNTATRSLVFFTCLKKRRARVLVLDTRPRIQL